MKLSIICILLISSLTTCKKHHHCNDPSNPDCENYNPCYGKNVIHTNFRVTNALNGFPQLPIEFRLPSYDTLFTGSMRLEVPEGNPVNCTFKWQIGTDTTIYTQKALEIDLISWLSKGNWESNIQVNLTIKTPNNGCINIKDTLVTASRNIFFTRKEYRQGVFYGQWEGSTKFDTFYAVRRVVGMSIFRGVNIDPTGELFYFNAPFADSFLTIRNQIFNNSDPCEKRQLNAFSQPFPEEGYVYASLSERLYYTMTRFSFWIRKPGEEEKKYVFTGKFIYL